MVINFNTVKSAEHKSDFVRKVMMSFIVMIEQKGFIKGNEYELSPSQHESQTMWIDQASESMQITVIVNAKTLSAEFGVVDKKSRKIMFSESAKALMCSGKANGEIVLTNTSEERLAELLALFDNWIGQLEAA